MKYEIKFYKKILGLFLSKVIVKDIFSYSFLKIGNLLSIRKNNGDYSMFNYDKFDCFEIIKNSNLPECEVGINQTPIGLMLYHKKDEFIGASIYNGNVQGINEIADVINFLKTKYNWNPETFIDIGANIGTHSICAAKVHNFKEVFAVEPAKNNCRLLRANIHLNDLQDKIKVFEIGLSDVGTKDIIKKLKKSPINFADYRIESDKVSKKDVHKEHLWEEEQIVISSFDRLFASNKFKRNSTLVWIDTQGYDIKVLKKAKKITNNGIPFVFEYWPYGLHRSGTTLEEVKKLLSGCDNYLIKNFSSLPTDFLQEYWDKVINKEGTGYSPFVNILVIPHKN